LNLPLAQVPIGLLASVEPLLSAQRLGNRALGWGEGRIAVFPPGMFVAIARRCSEE
jgi:hypothetical protein